MDIMQELHKHREFVQKQGYIVLGTFLHGSQNYGLDTEYSDVDTNTVVLPSLDMLVRGSKRVSTTLVLPNNEHSSVKDISLLFSTFKRANINFLEMLFTNYFLVDPDYLEDVMRLQRHAERIVLADYQKLFNVILGIIYENRKNLTSITPENEGRVKRVGYNSKHLQHMFRLAEFLERLDSGESFEACLRSKNIEFLKMVKYDPLYTVGAALYYADDIVERMNKLKNDSIRYETAKVDTSIDMLLDDVLYRIMKKSLRKVLL